MEKYSKAYYLEAFKGDSTDELLRRYANGNLNREANDAIRDLLSQRGVPSDTVTQYKSLDENGKVIMPKTSETSDQTGCLVIFRLLLGAILLLVAGIALFIGVILGGSGAYRGPIFLFVIAVVGVLVWALSPLGKSKDAKKPPTDA